MTESDTAWAAGLLEGEGYFGYASNGHGLRITCGMTDEDVLVRLQRIFGGRFQTVKRLPDRKPVFTWSMSSRAEVIPLLLAVRPYMGSRRGAVIDGMLEWDRAYPLGRPRKDTAPHGAMSKYRNGCRCAECVTGAKSYRRKMKANGTL